MAAPEPAEDLEVLARAAVRRAATALDQPQPPAWIRKLSQELTRGAGRAADYDDIITDLERRTEEISRAGGILQRCLDELLRREREAARDNPGSDIWWNTRARAVGRAVSAGHPGQALRLLSAAWVDALALRDWERCEALLSVGPDTSETAGMHVVTTALATGAYATALDRLDQLLGGSQPVADRIDREAAVRLGVLRTRILEGEYSDVELIRRSARAAVERAGTGPARPLALAARAEAELAVGEVDAARATIAEAPADCTDVRVVTGLLYERDGLWALADSAYDGALEDDERAATAALLRPVPPRLLLRAAGRSMVDTQDALVLLERALKEIPADDERLRRDVQLARAERLTELAHRQDVAGEPEEARRFRRRAAGVLVDVAERQRAGGATTRAMELFRRACELAPDVAEIRWRYGETLRLAAWRVDGTVDTELLDSARQHLDLGLRRRRPNDDEAWVFVTQALIAETLSLQPSPVVPPPEQDPALLVERALLKDPGYGAGYCFLAEILRGQGFPAEADEVVRAGQDISGSAEGSYDIRLALLLDLGEYDAALRLIDLQQLRQPGEMRVWERAELLLRTGRAEEALATLSGAEPTDPVRLLRGYCLQAAGKVAAARSEFRSLWSDTAAGPAPNIAGWAAFRAGMPDRGIELYRELAARAPLDTPYRRDLGQMLLVRGDVEEGAALLRQGIDDCPFAADLDQLRVLDLAYVRDATAHRPHGTEVAGVLAELEQRIDRRCARLREARRPVGDVATRLAAARAALHAGDPLTALAGYEQLAGSDEVPEASVAAVRAGRAACEEADRLLAVGEHAEARRRWSTVERTVAGMPEDGAELLHALACRQQLADLADGAQDEVAAWLGTVEDDPVRPALAGAAGVLAYDAAHLWALRDGLLALRDRPDVSPGARGLVDWAVSALPLGRAYQLDAVLTAGDTLSSTFVAVNSLELRLGPGVQQLCESPELAGATADLQRRIEEEMGVRIPWVYAVAGPRLEEGRAEVRVFGTRTRGAVLSGPEETWVTQVLELVEDVVRGYLFRFVGVDDVALWLEGWDPTTADAPSWNPTDPAADRLRLARVLRMLLREHVSVRDRGIIVAAVRSAPDVGRRGESATLNTLRDVRRRLGPKALGVGPDMTVLPLPAELEQRAAGGLAVDRPVWELPRTEARTLIEDIRTWLREQPAPPDVVRVDGDRVRPFVWRLLAAERPAVRVLSAEELS